VANYLLLAPQQPNSLSVAVTVLLAGDKDINKRQSLPLKSLWSNGGNTGALENDLAEKITLS
jgi:hypothetical protein